MRIFIKRLRYLIGKIFNFYFLIFQFLLLDFQRLQVVDYIDPSRVLHLLEQK